MKISLRRRRNLKELRQMLHEMVDRLDDVGIHYVASANFYFTPVDEDGKEVKPKKNGCYVKDFKIENPYSCAADQKGIL